MRHLNLVAAALVLSLMALPAFAQPSLGIGLDVFHTWSRESDSVSGSGKQVSAAMYIELRWRLPISKHWSVNPYIGQATGEFGETVYGLDFAVDIKRWTFGIGATRGEANDIVNSDLQYEVRFERRFSGCLALSLVHNSNGAGSLDGTHLPQGDEPNDGYNFIMGRFPLYQCKGR
jgi:hypothetical protein